MGGKESLSNAATPINASSVLAAKKYNDWDKKKKVA